MFLCVSTCMGAYVPLCVCVRASAALCVCVCVCVCPHLAGPSGAAQQPSQAGLLLAAVQGQD